MEIYLLTSYRILSEYYKGENYAFQKLIQVNSAALLEFILIVIMLIQYLYYKELISNTYTLIINKIFYLAGQIFIDNLDFNIINNRIELEL